MKLRQKSSRKGGIPSWMDPRSMFSSAPAAECKDGAPVVPDAPQQASEQGLMSSMSSMIPSMSSSEQAPRAGGRKRSRRRKPKRNKSRVRKRR